MKDMNKSFGIYPDLDIIALCQNAAVKYKAKI